MRILNPRRFLLIAILFLQASLLFSAIPAGYYYLLKNKKQAALKTAIHNYCLPMKELAFGSGYGFTWQGFYNTDRRPDSTVIDMYSNTVRKQTSYAAVNGMHIEHSFPKSWWGAYENGAYKDLFHLYPADASANESKNNLPLGEVTGTPGFDNGVTKVGKNGFETAYTDNCFEPADQYKGDFARSYFYIASVYEDLAPLMQSPMVITGSTYPFFKKWSIDLLLKWNKQDPVSDKERARIEAVYGIQGNRNPFIDYPDLAEYIWGADTTQVYPFPAETDPFLITPRRGMTIDFGVILQNDTRTQTLHVQGVNLTSNLQCSLAKNSPSFSLAQQFIPAATAINGIDLSITFTPSAAGSVRDTLLIQGGGLADIIRIPVKALASADFITVEPTDVTPVGGTLQWISDPLATQYRLNVYQGDQKAGDLIISTYVDGSSWNKALELYNGTGKTIDLSKYWLQKQSNGTGYFGSTLKLSGTLDNGKSYVIAHKLSAADLQAKAQLVTDSVLQFNGNDAVQLVRSGVTIDMVGAADAGADVIWGNQLTLQRKATVTHPLSVFNQAEWITLPSDSYAMLGSHPMTLASSSNTIIQNVIVGLSTSYPIENLVPANTYTYNVESMRSGVIVPAINTMQLQTSSLDAPDIVDASNVLSNEFTANWDETAYATGYLLDVMKLNGQADTTVVEGFDNIGTSGTPVLPSGWSGNASGIYTTTTSSGVATPSINLKTNKEWLQPKTYSQAVSKFTFMYRFASTSTGSSVILDGQSNNSWVRLDSLPYKNTSKYYPVYAFTKDQNIKAFKFTFNKPAAGGNLAIDDVAATYGNQDTVYVTKDKVVASNYSVVTGLNENTQYFYRVNATLGSSVSPVSLTTSVKTLVNTKIQDIVNLSIKIKSFRDHINISGLQGNETIQVYSTTGICIYHDKVWSEEKNIPILQSGIFILRIQNNQNTFTGKFLK